MKKENETLSFCRLTSSHASCYTRVIRAYIYTAITEFIAYQTRTDLSLLRSITARLPFDHAPIVFYAAVWKLEIRPIDTFFFL